MYICIYRILSAEINIIASRPNAVFLNWPSMFLNLMLKRRLGAMMIFPINVSRFVHHGKHCSNLSCRFPAYLFSRLQTCRLRCKIWGANAFHKKNSYCSLSYETLNTNHYSMSSFPSSFICHLVRTNQGLYCHQTQVKSIPLWYVHNSLKTFSVLLCSYIDTSANWKKLDEIFIPILLPLEVGIYQ